MASLLKAKATVLSPRALELKRQIEKQTAAAAPEKADRGVFVIVWR